MNDSILTRRNFLKATGIGAASLLAGCGGTGSSAKDASGKARKPNIVFILADDMGIDSVNALNKKCGIATPCLNKLITQGMTFTDAHSGSAVCSPTRYGVLTGRYSWRTRMKQGIVNKWERPLIDKDRLTVGGMLQAEGYHTACIGKWHLGWNWLDAQGKPTEKLQEIDFTKPVKGGPIERGFDYYFGDDVPNWPPYVWVENDRLQGVPTDTMARDRSNGVSSGPAMPGWRFENVLPTITQKCVDYIGQMAKEDRPFFLYFAMTSPHTPINPSERFRGKSGVSKYADFIMETDWSVGQVVDAVDKNGLSDNTLVIFTADNGTSPKCRFDELEQKGVRIREHWRGHKADIWEGGHRVPFIARWPGVIRPGSTSGEVISLVDFMTTAAEIVGFELADNAAEDSVSLVGAFREQQRRASVREAIVCQSSRGYLAVRKGKWKAEFCGGSGGWSSPARESEAKELGLPPVQLYDLQIDPKEQNNLYAKHPDIADELLAILKRYVRRGRSTPGAQQTNDDPKHWEQLTW
ncbi:MAG: sulfatase-like hydrolase/transferase [Planctomycetota bacterium]|jgi:arylsulfatase A-like enzyme